MWSSRSDEMGDVRGLRFTVDLDSRPATFAATWKKPFADWQC